MDRPTDGARVGPCDDPPWPDPDQLCRERDDEAPGKFALCCEPEYPWFLEKLRTDELPLDEPRFDEKLRADELPPDELRDEPRLIAEEDLWPPPPERLMLDRDGPLDRLALEWPPPE